MAKGKASANSLKALAHPLQQFINTWGHGQHSKLKVANQGSLPPLLQLYALRGEGILNQRFFNALMPKIPMQLTPQQQIELWQKLVEDNGYIQQWVERLGVYKALLNEANLEQYNPQHARTYFCILLDALNQYQPQLLSWAVEGYFYHVFKSQFPELNYKPKVQVVPKTIRELKTALLSQLAMQFKEKIETKESFNQTPEVVNFKILYKLSSVNVWQVLIETERPTLKMARVVAYNTALKISPM